jgi:hypothetical protein
MPVSRREPRADASSWMACHTRAVPGLRKIVSYLLLLGALVLSVPAVTLAAGGGSAGDQQYTDPFATQPGSSSSHKPTTPSTTTTAAAPATTTTAPAPATTTTASGDPTTATTPTATTASNPSANTLPYTGYDSWLAGGFGLVLAGAGLSLRRKAQRS